MLTTRSQRRRVTLAACLLVLAILIPAHAADPELLEPEQAFRFTARLVSPRLIEVQYRVADGYYLYKSRLDFRLDTSAARLGPPEMPTGTWHEDEFFGRSEIYRGEVAIRLPLLDDAPRVLVLVAVAQGCADIGVCYLPTAQRVTLLSLTGARRNAKK
jgi:thiol:disulfide interchange protein DsbD